MHSSNFYRNYSSPYKAPSKSANTYDVTSNRSRSNLHDIYDETWPLDEVINKIDIKSDSEDDFGYSARNAATANQSWNSSAGGVPFDYSNSRYARDPDRLYAAFPASARRYDYSPRRETLADSGNRWHKAQHSYDTNNNYLSDDTEFEDDSPSLRDVAIQCNLKKYPKSVQQSAAEPTTTVIPLSMKPPIKVIKSSTNGFVSAYSDVPKLGSAPRSNTLDSQYAALDFEPSSSMAPTPEPDAIYSQVDKSGKTGGHRPPSSNSNINIIYKQPLNETRESITTYRVAPDSKVYDVKSKEFGFNVASNPNAPRLNLANPMPMPNSTGPNYLETPPSRMRSYNGSYRDLNDVPSLAPVEKEILEETISISNASTEDSYRPMDRLTVDRAPPNRYGDNLSYTSKTSSNYRRESPVRPANYERSSLSKQSPYGTMEKHRSGDSKANSKLNKKKTKSTAPAPPKNDENVLLANNSLRLKSSKRSHPPSERLYKSNADLRDQFLRDETRGGLAAAYKNRQHQSQNPNRTRALSLSRMNAIGHEDDPTGSSGPPPSRYLSQTHLNGGGTSSRLSDSNSSYHRSGRHTQHERDPIVMYIPTVNHQRAATGESPKLTSILRNNSTKSSTTTATLPSKGKKAKEAKSQSKVNLKEAAAREKAEKEKDKKKKADLNRRHSMPKDAKLNGAGSSWFSKFKLKSNK